jgi:UDP-glucose 4-epimerase
VARVLADAVVGRVSSPVPINLALGTRSSVLDLLGALEGVLEAPVQREHVDPRPGDVRDSQASCTRLVQLFPDVSAVPLERGLSETVAWFRHA